MPALCRASLVLLLASILGLPPALAQSERPGQWTDPPNRAGTPSATMEGRGSGPSSAVVTRRSGRQATRATVRASAASTRTRSSAARTVKRHNTKRSIAGRTARIRAASVQRSRATLKPGMRSVRLDRRPTTAVRRNVHLDSSRYRHGMSGPARRYKHVGAVGGQRFVHTARPRPMGHAVTPSRPEEDSEPFDLFDPDRWRFDGCE